ncbi:CGNR zinc finger domain-containing protein [Phytohabitans suffuscus]|uniref:CGNR zinc finger domain-containing protein n=1 Tax=Phytohabitans suffuscus TaxID=624315 RepID=UPI001563DD98|nr:ABATE domain-containing protein [Phytohabitans suffuscus]
MNDVGRMRIVGGSLALDYVNTRSGPPAGPPDDDVLHRYDDLVAWARHAGVVTEPEAARLRRQARARPDDARDLFQRALGVRDHLDALFRTVATGGRPSGRQLARLSGDTAEALAHAQLVLGDGHYRWRWTGHQDLGRPLWPVVHAAAELLTTGPLERIKTCSGCRFVFVDESKNRSRRWCSMEDCGTAAKIRRYVARRAASRH